MQMQSPNLLKGGQEGEKSLKAGPSQERLRQKRRTFWRLKAQAVERQSKAYGEETLRWNRRAQDSDIKKG